MKFEVGQKLYFVGRESWHKTQEVTVTKLGRKWVCLSNGYRCDHQGLIDGGKYSPFGTLHESKEVYEAEAALKKEWSASIRTAYICKMPGDMTIEKIHQISKLMGLL